MKGVQRPLPSLGFGRMAPPKDVRWFTEHCEGCQTQCSRGSLRNVQLDAGAQGLTGWVALCRRCLREKGLA